MSHGVKTFLSVIAIILTTLCKLTAPAGAQFIFNPLQNLGGSVVTAPSCAAAASGSTFCGVVGVGGHLFLNQVDNFTSFGFTDLGGIVIGKPSCTHFGLGQPEPLFRVLCGVIGTDSAVWVSERLSRQLDSPRQRGLRLGSLQFEPTSASRDPYPSTGITSTAVASRCCPEPNTTPPMGATSA